MEEVSHLVWVSNSSSSITKKIEENRQIPWLLCFLSWSQLSSGKLMEGGHIHPRLFSEASQAYWRVSHTNPRANPSKYWCKLIPWSPRSVMVSSILDSSGSRSKEGKGWDSGRFSEVRSSNSLWKVINSSWEADRKKQDYHKWNNII